MKWIPVNDNIILLTKIVIIKDYVSYLKQNLMSSDIPAFETRKTHTGGHQEVSMKMLSLKLDNFSSSF